MNKKIIGVIFLVVSVLLFFFSISQLIQGSLTKANQTYTLQSNFSALLMDHKSPEKEIEQVRNYLLAHPDYEKVIFSGNAFERSQKNSDKMNSHVLSIATTLGLTLDEQSSYYGGYDHNTNECYWLPIGVAMIQVTETHDYYYMVNVKRDVQTTGTFLWTLEDSKGNPLFQVKDLSTSSQGKVTLEPGIYYLYDSYDQLENVDVQLTLSKE